MEGERSEELDYVLTSKNITSVDGNEMVLRNTAIGIIRRGLSIGIIEERGRTFSLTHQPLAKQLIKEWLLAVDEKRMVNFINALSDDKHNWLIKEFHNRFVAMNDDDAKQMVSELFKIGGIFEKSEVLNTEGGLCLLILLQKFAPMMSMKCCIVS